MSIEQNNSEERNTTEKEIIVPLDDLSSTAIEDTEKNIVENTSSENSKNEHEAKQESKSIQKLVEKKPINSLSEDERALIIANAKAGIDQPYFDVKFLKNGNVRITKKKAEQKSVASKVVSAKPPTKNAQQVYYTDNQLLFEHIIELNAKIDRLTHKHKKLKRRYQTLQDDLYVDSEDQVYSIKDSEENVQNNQPNEHIETTNHGQDVDVNNLEPQRVATRTIKNTKNNKNGWRSQVLFL